MTNKLQVYLLMAGALLFWICVVIFYGTIQYWFYIPYDLSMMIPIGFCVASVLCIGSMIVAMDGE